MDILPAAISTFGLAFFYFIGAIPAGVGLGLSPVLAAIIAWLSYTAGVALVALGGAPLRAWLMRRFKFRPEQHTTSLIGRVWQRYGLLGLSLLAPVTVGAQLGALIGVALGVPPRRLVIGLSLGVIVWCIGIGLAITLGLQVVRG
jgi:hypothetical protein